MGGIVVLVPTTMVAGKLAAIGKEVPVGGHTSGGRLLLKHGMIKGAALGIQELGVRLAVAGRACVSPAEPCSTL